MQRKRAAEESDRAAGREMAAEAARELEREAARQEAKRQEQRDWAAKARDGRLRTPRGRRFATAPAS